MSETANIYSGVSKYWFDKWRITLEQKNFDVAAEYFKRAVHWRQKARVHDLTAELSEKMDTSYGGNK